MNALEIFGILASAASIASLLFAGFVYHREKIHRINEASNIHISRVRLKAIANSLSTTANYLQYLIRQADDPDMPVREFQNMARGVRAGLLTALVEAQDMKLTLDQWKIGEFLGSGESPSPEATKEPAPPTAEPSSDEEA